MKHLTYKGLLSLLLILLVVYFYPYLPNFLLDLFRINKPEYVYVAKDLSALSIFLTLFLALIEESIFRLFLTFKGWFPAIWTTVLIFISVITLNTALNSDNIYIFTLGYFCIAFTSLFLISRFKQSSIYRLFYTPSNFRNVISAFTFCIIHITTFRGDFNNFWLVLYLIVLYSPGTVFFTSVRLNYKHGFWIATGFHFLYNILFMILNFIVR